MEEKVKKSVASAIIMGMIIPLSSLIYVRKEGTAITLLSFFVFSVLGLIVTPIVYFATSFWIFIIIIGLILICSFLLGVWYAYIGVDDDEKLKDQGLWISAYILLFLLIMTLFSYVPVGFFTTKSAYLDFSKNEVLVLQKNPDLKYLRVLDYVVFLDEDYNEALGQVIALPGDVLKYENGKTLRNDKPYDIVINLPVQLWIVPEDIMLIHYSSRSMPKDDESEGEKVAAVVNKTTNKEMQPKAPNEVKSEAVEANNKSLDAQPYQAVILPMERIRSKALYALFSTNLSNIGKSLTQNITP